jgi:hypothetical protein
MRLQFKDKWLTKEDKAAIKKALIAEKEEMDSVRLYVEVNNIKICAEWVGGNKYKADVLYGGWQTI